MKSVGSFIPDASDVVVEEALFVERIERRMMETRVGFKEADSILPRCLWNIRTCISMKA